MNQFNYSNSVDIKCINKKDKIRAKVLEIIKKIKRPIFLICFIYLTSISLIAIKNKIITMKNSEGIKEEIVKSEVTDIIVEENSDKALKEAEEKLLEGETQIVVEPGSECVIDIESIGLRAKCKKGVDQSVLKNYAGIFPESCMPGENGNFCVAAHNNIYTELFKNLYKLKVKEQIKVVTREKEYIYEVNLVEKINPTRLDVLEQNANSKEITLLTCTDMAKNRIVVKGSLIAERVIN